MLYSMYTNPEIALMGNEEIGTSPLLLQIPHSSLSEAFACAAARLAFAANLKAQKTQRNGVVR